MPQRRRIIALFGLGIVLPSLLLGYLAFRGIQNDRALVEKDRLEDTRQRAGRIVGTVENGIAAVETELSRIVETAAGAAPAEIVPALEKFAAANPLVEQIFFSRDLEPMAFPVAEPLYVPDGRRRSVRPPIDDPNVTGDLRAAERCEFQTLDYAGALRAYRQALDKTHDPISVGLILNGLARAQRKSGLVKEAIATYETIVREHGRAVLPGGMPLGPSASLEAGTLWMELGHPEKALQGCSELFRSLARRKWDLEKTEYDFFIDRATALVEGLLAGEPAGVDPIPFRKEFRDLQDEEARARRRTARLFVFQEGAPSVLNARIAAAASPGGKAPVSSKLSLNLGSNCYLVSLRKPTQVQGTPSAATWGIIIDAERLREAILRPALGADMRTEAVSWEVKERDGTVIQSSGPPVAGPVTLRTGFAGDVPDWTIEFRQAPPRLIKSFLLSGRGLYSFAFLLIAGILVFGLVLTIRSVSHELELARMKSDFVSTVSHEFKSPLTSIRQLAEMLQSGRVPSDERRQKYYDVLLEQSERLALLTDNILSLARIEEGRSRFTLEPTDLPVLLSEVVTSFRERVRHEGFDIALEAAAGLPPVAADRTALSQALANLLDNAVKYSGGARRIEVRAVAEGPAVMITVKDFGVGIAEADLDRIFERFYRAGDQLTRSVKGSGLGLALVKEIVEAHGGQVGVESEPGKGSTFSIRLSPSPNRGEGR